MNEKQENETAMTLDSLPCAVLGMILSYGYHSDALTLRTTCKEIKKEVDDCLYEASMEKLRHPVTFDRTFPPAISASASIRLGGKYRNNTEATEFALEKLDLGQGFLKKKIIKELSKTGHSSGWIKGKLWRRELSSKHVTRLGIMRAWISFYQEIKKDQKGYLTMFDHNPKEKLATIEGIYAMNRIMFGLYVGSSDDLKLHMTRICRIDTTRGREVKCTTSSDEHYLCFDGLSGGTIIVETKRKKRNYHC